MLKIVSFLGVLGMLGASAAQAQGHLFQAQIPFDFHVAKQTFTAGTYRLDYNLGNQILSLQSVDEPSKTGVVLVGSWFEEPNSKAPELVFRCEGKACYLAELREGPDYAGAVLNVPNSGTERRISLLTRAIPLTGSGR